MLKQFIQRKGKKKSEYCFRNGSYLIFNVNYIEVSVSLKPRKKLKFCESNFTKLFDVEVKYLKKKNKSIVMRESVLITE